MKPCPVCGSKDIEIKEYVLPVEEEIVRYRGECHSCGTKTLKYYDTPWKVERALSRYIIIRGKHPTELGSYD